MPHQSKSSLASEVGEGTSNLDGQTMATEAGEVLKRRRAGGPWVPDLSVERPTRGSSKLALDIASSFERRKRAVEQFEELVYAPGTLATKDSLFKLWVQISERCGHPSLPVTCTLMREVAAILRASGFRAVTKKVYEAKGRGPAFSIAPPLHHSTPETSGGSVFSLT